MEWYKGAACVTYRELTDGNPNSSNEKDWPIMTLFVYRNLRVRGQIEVLRRACYESPALVEFKSLPLKYREAYVAKYGDPEKSGKSWYLNDRIVLDPRANDYFSRHVKPNGDHLTPEQIRTRTMNVSILNAVGEIMRDRLAMN